MKPSSPRTKRQWPAREGVCWLEFLAGKQRKHEPHAPIHREVSLSAPGISAWGEMPHSRARLCTQQTGRFSLPILFPNGRLRYFLKCFGIACSPRSCTAVESTRVCSQGAHQRRQTPAAAGGGHHLARQAGRQAGETRSPLSSNTAFVISRHATEAILVLSASLIVD